MVEITIKKLLGLKGLNAISDIELKKDLDTFSKKDLIDFLMEIPKDNISFLFQEQESYNAEGEEEVSI